MQSGSNTLWVSLAFLWATACGPAPTALNAELPYTFATNSCGPTDGAAVSIAFTSSAQPIIQPVRSALVVNVWAGIGEIAGRRYRLANDSNDGSAWYSSADSARNGAASGTVRVFSRAPDSSIVGTVNLRLNDGTRVERDFTATWRPTRMLCG